MDSFETRQDIAATGDTVWAVLVDGARYPVWVPGLADVEGDVADGQIVRFIADEDGRDVNAKVVAAINRRHLRWEASAPLAVFTDVHSFSIADTEFGCTLVLVRELSGPLEPLLSRSVEDPQTEVEQLAAALKAEAESREGGGALPDAPARPTDSRGSLEVPDPEPNPEPGPGGTAGGAAGPA